MAGGRVNAFPPGGCEIHVMLGGARMVDANHPEPRCGMRGDSGAADVGRYRLFKKGIYFSDFAGGQGVIYRNGGPVSRVWG